jgi:hypothetical protein
MMGEGVKQLKFYVTMNVNPLNHTPVTRSYSYVRQCLRGPWLSIRSHGIKTCPNVSTEDNKKNKEEEDKQRKYGKGATNAKRHI